MLINLRYVKKGNHIEKARAALRKVRDTEEEVEQELLEIREAIEYEKEAISGNYSALWKDKSLRKRMALALVLNAGQQVTGQGSLNSYSTKIYKKVFTSDSQIALINALNATFGILFTLNAVWIIDRFGRKFLLIVGGIGMGLCMIIVSAVETETPVLANGAKSESVGISIVFLLFLFIFFCGFLFLLCYLEDLADSFVYRQTILGCNCVDLDIRNLLHECPRPGRGHGITDTKCRQRHRTAVLPHLLGQRRLLRLLHVCWNQLPARCVCFLPNPRDQAGSSRRN